MKNKERQAKFKQSKKEKGFIRIELWINPNWKQAIIDYVNKLKGIEEMKLHFASSQSNYAKRHIAHKDFDFLSDEAKGYVLGNLSDDLDNGFRVQDPKYHSPAQIMTRNQEMVDVLYSK